MKEQERYELRMRHQMSTRSAIRNIAKTVLLKEGIDITLVNIKEEGVSIEAFGKLVEQIYQAGYKDGLIQYRETQNESRDSEYLGSKLIGHARRAKTISKKSLINNHLSL